MENTNFRKSMLSYANPETKEEIATNLVYLLRENETMKNFQAFKLGNTLDSSNTDNVRWTFLEKILPKLNTYFNVLWKEEQLQKNEEKIKILEENLKSKL